MLIRKGALTNSESDLRVVAFNRNRQAILRQLGVLLFFGLGLLNSLLWQEVPLTWVMADIILTLLAGSWLLNRYIGYGAKTNNPRQ
jgi:hypothetical protein